MDFRLRRFFVGLISLAAVLAIYLLYSRMSKAPVIDIGTGAEFVETIADSNVGESGGEIGKIGGVGVEGLKRTVYRHRNENGQVDREFGFDELLYEVKDIWEVEKPWMNAYQRSFRCYITADQGTARLETAVGRPTPKDATFTGNVVIHILPENSSKIKESRIYLDDLTFLSERSQFSTGGPVKFVSEDAQMLGTGLELVYDDQMERLEFLRIIDLESLRLKSSQTPFLPGATKQADRPADTGGQAKAQQPDEPTMAGDRQKAQALPTTSRQAVGQTTGQYYKCVFSKNVAIDTPEQLVFADERVCINDIFWSEASSEKSEEANIDGIDDTKTIAGTAEQGWQSKAGSVGADNTKINTTTVSEQSEPNGLPEESVDIVITCDGGVVVTPMDSRQAVENFAKAGIGATGSESQRLKKFDDTTGRTTFIARRIDHSAVTGDTVASGSSELTFYVDDFGGARTKKTPLPAKLTAQKQARFLAASNQVIFEGDCRCTMLREDPNVLTKYILSSQQLLVDLPKDTNDQSSTSTAGVEHLTATGGVVRLATVKTAGVKEEQNRSQEKSLGGTELKCRRFDYDAGQELFVATGPGEIRLDNSTVAEPNEQKGGFSLEGPCWAIIEDFDTLKYFLQSNRIIAEAESEEGLVINYFPIREGKFAEHIIVNAGHVEADLVQTADGQTELSALTASGRITYEDEENEFAGGELFYDHKTSVMKVEGDEFQPCYFNGALVEGIELNLRTGKVEAKVVAPGPLQMNR